MQIGAIAGGNAVVLKPSEQTPLTAALFAELIPEYLDNDLFQVVNGAIPETTRVSIAIRCSVSSLRLTIRT